MSGKQKAQADKAAAKAKAKAAPPILERAELEEEATADDQGALRLRAVSDQIISGARERLSKFERSATLALNPLTTVSRSSGSTDPLPTSKAPGLSLTPRVTAERRALARRDVAAIREIEVDEPEATATRGGLHVAPAS